MEKRAVQSVPTCYLFSNGLQKFEKKKRNRFALERGRKILSVEFCCNIKCFLPKTLLGLKWYLKLETAFHQSFHQGSRIKIELVLSW